FDALQAAGGIKSTARDMIRYLAANLGSMPVEERLAEAMSLALQQHFSGNRTVGLGWHIGNTTYGKIYDHNGLVGGYCSTNIICPQTKAGVVVLANNAGSVDALASAIMRILSPQ
ncbi:MAG: beta-lactamase family protein, partial [Firmicutes bacterium]|nr:beta-lactamase family protein [Bacillota bacterium]